MSAIRTEGGGSLNSAHRHIDVFIVVKAVTSLLLFILWGSFFIDHLSWFVVSGEPVPPLEIWLLQAAHLVFVAGYLVILKWERVGSVMIVLGALLFFTFAAREEAVPYFSISIVPVLVIIVKKLRQILLPQSFGIGL